MGSRRRQNRTATPTGETSLWHGSLACAKVEVDDVVGDGLECRARPATRLTGRKQRESLSTHPPCDRFLQYLSPRIHPSDRSRPAEPGKLVDRPRPAADGDSG